eukprot:scaffold211383_cov37-Tisochrysis_lutea.AAC.2
MLRPLATHAFGPAPCSVSCRRLVQIAGSTIVQQAGLSVNNAQQGFLPHGWLEYVDDVTGREYFYNVRIRSCCHP